MMEALLRGIQSDTKAVDNLREGLAYLHRRYPSQNAKLFALFCYVLHSRDHQLQCEAADDEGIDNEV